MVGSFDNGMATHDQGVLTSTKQHDFFDKFQMFDYDKFKMSHYKMIKQNISNFSRSGSPTRVMFYDNGSWADFGADVVVSVRSGFEEGKTKVEVKFDGVIHLFDASRMLLRDLKGANLRPIAWIDVGGHCLFPFYLPNVEIFDVIDALTDGNKKNHDRG
ncbi:hypothetical protein Vadar_029312 [Vaccinium darrowii]|nr:hypothetical protein Vadar_029312 [Vaccinium darrowii]